MNNYINRLISDNTLKDGGGPTLLSRILLDNNVTSSTSADEIKEISITSEILAPFLIDKKFQKYSYFEKEYKGQDGKPKYLWSIVNEVMADREYMKSLKVLKKDKTVDEK